MTNSWANDCNSWMARARCSTLHSGILAKAISLKNLTQNMKNCSPEKENKIHEFFHNQLKIQIYQIIILHQKFHSSPNQRNFTQN